MKSYWRLPIAAAALFVLAVAAGYLLTLVGTRAVEPPVPSTQPSRPATLPGAAPPPASLETGYRIKLMEEVAPAKGWKEEASAPPMTRRRSGPAEVLVHPRGEVLLSVIVDASQSLATPDGEALLEEMRGAIEDLAATPRDAIRIGARTAGSGDEDDCAGSRQMLLPASLGREAPSRLAPGGPRNLSQAMYRSAGDMASRQGHKGMVLVVTGDEECGEWPCETAKTLFRTREGYRTWVYRMLPSPVPAPTAEPATADTPADVPTDATAPEPTSAPEATVAATLPPATDPPLPGIIECIGESAGGKTGSVRGRAELANALRGVIDDLSTNLTVRLKRASNGRELTGESRPALPWRVTLSSPEGAGDQASGSLPARFIAPAGRWRVTLDYGGTVMHLGDLELSPGDEAEVIFDLVAGQLTVLAAGRGWPAAGDCSPRVRVSPAADETATIAERCGLPASFALPPGDYLVAVESPAGESSRAAVTLRDGDPSTVRVAPGAAPEIVVDKRDALP